MVINSCQQNICQDTSQNNPLPIEAGDNADFIIDTTIPDGTELAPSSTFIKKWKVKNNGTTTWSTGYKLVFNSGNKLGGSNYISIPQNVAPGQTIDLAVNLTAPIAPGNYRGYWKLQNASGQSFGDILWVDIKVNETAVPINVAGEIKLYSQSGFNGLLGSYGQGDTNAPSANSYAISIPSGWSVKTYRNDGNSGDMRCWYESVSNLQDHSWHNAIQSMQIYNYNACTAGQKIKLYSQANYGGSLLNEIDPTSTGNNSPSHNSYSMQIPTGWSVKTWSQDNTVGESRCWTTSIPNLQDHSWHNKIESVRVYTNNECGTGTGSWARLCRQTGAHSGTDCHDITQDIPKLGAANSMGTYSFGNDVAKSVWMSGPWEMMLFEHENYQGAKYKYRDSNNDIRNYPDNGDTSDYGTSSVKVRLYDQGLVTFYHLGDFNDGNPFKTDNTLDNLGHWDYDNVPQSVKVKPGYQGIFCTDPNFHGTCGRLKGTEPEWWGGDLNAIAQGLRSGVSSVRICKDECDPTPPPPNLLETNDDSNLLPNSTVNFYWSGEGEQFKIEVSGGDLSAPINSGWLTSKTWSKSGLAKSSNPYVWRVKAWSQVGESNWSESKELFIKEIAPIEAYVVAPDQVEVGSNFEAYAYVTPADVSNLTYTWSPAPSEGQGTASVKYNNNTLGTKTVSVTVSNSAATKQASKDVIVANPAPACTNVFCAEYFNNTNMTGAPVYTNTTSEVSYDWGGGGPGNGVNNDNFSARWIGNFDFEAATYKFRGWSDDGIRVFIDGVQFMEDWIDHGVRDVITNKSISAGMHEIKIEFKEAGGGAAVGLEWEEISEEPEGCTPELNKYCVSFFNNKTLSGTAVNTAKVTTIDNDWGLNSPATNVNSDNFSARWIGTFNFAEGGDYRFTTTSDDGIKLFVDGQVLIDQWNDHGTQIDNATVNLSAGNHDIKLEFYDSVVAAVSKLSWVKLTSDPCANVFCAEYFNNTNMTGTPVYTNTTPQINYNWGGGGPGNGIGVDNFSARWVGNFNFTAGNYRFKAWSDDGVRVYIDGELILEDWVDHGVRDAFGNKTITNGTHEVKVEFKEAGGGAIIGLEWAEVPPNNASCSTIPTNEFCVEYFNNVTLSGDVVYSTHFDEIDKTWGESSPGPGVNANSFSDRWVGNFTFEAGDYKFETNSDNGVKLYVDNVLKINNWVSHPPTVDTATVTMTAGVHTIKLEHFENQYSASIILNWEKIIPNNPSGCINTFCGEYFNNTSMSGTPVFTNNVNVINFSWNQFGPGNGVNDDNFSVRWVGEFDFIATTYNFNTWSDDGIRLYVDNVLLIDDWVDHGVNNIIQSKVMTAGRHQIKVEYKEVGGHAIAGVDW